MGFTTIRHGPGATAFHALALCALLAAGPAQAAEPALGLKAAVALAIANNPGLAAAAARADAAATRPDQAGALPDPALSFRAMNLPVDSFNSTQEAMTQMQIGVSQRVPFPGKRSLRERAARHEADARAAESREALLRVVREVKTGWWSILYLDRALSAVARNLGLLRNLLEIAQTKYEVGQGLQQDVLLAQVELSKLLDAEIRLRGERRRVRARFNALLDRPAQAAVVLPAEVDVALPALPANAELVEQARLNRPLLVAERSRLRAAETARELAELDFYPDFSLNAGYGVRGGRNPDRSARADFLSLGVSLSIPLYAGRKQTRAVEQAKAEASARRAGLRDLTGRVEAEIASALASYDQAADQAGLLFSGIIPQARQTVDAMRAGYLVSKVDFLNLVRAQTTLYDYDTRYWRALSEANKALAELAAAVGQETIHE